MILPARSDIMLVQYGSAVCKAKPPAVGLGEVVEATPKEQKNEMNFWLVREMGMTDVLSFSSSLPSLCPSSTILLRWLLFD